MTKKNQKQKKVIRGENTESALSSPHRKVSKLYGRHRKSGKPISFWNPHHLVVSFFGVGRIPFMSGTWGSLAAAIIAFVIVLLPQETASAFPPQAIFPTLGALAFLAFVAGVHSTTRYAEITGTHDSGVIVMDEVSGMWLTYALAGAGYWGLLQIDQFAFMQVLPLSPFFAIALFILFRVFDVWKPWIIGRIQDKMLTPLGVMLDDTLAAVFAVVTFFIVFLIGFYAGILPRLAEKMMGS